MSLPPNDFEFLSRTGNHSEVLSEANMTCILIRGYRLPYGYDLEHSDLLLRLSPGYPDVPPDMWWFSPAIHLASSSAIPATEVTESYLGRPWQRWSRHLAAGQWISGVDCLESFLAIIRRELERWAPQPVK